MRPFLVSPVRSCAGLSRFTNAEISGAMGLPLIRMFQSVTLDYCDGRCA
jgi:hypothetical protein